MSDSLHRRRSRESRHVKLLRQLVPKPLRLRQMFDGAIRRRVNEQVQAGPFTGLTFPSAAAAAFHPSTFLGGYEKAIAPVVEEICKLDGAKVINIGASFGYYAVGFPFRNASIRSVCYETTPGKQQLIAEAAALNGVADRVQVRGYCTREELIREVNDATVIFSDCEGAELILVDPLRVPALARIPLLVEVHGFIIAGAEEEMVARFEATHTIQRLWDDEPAIEPFPWSDGVFAMAPSRLKHWAMTEPRTHVTPWLWMKPRPAV